MTSTPEHLENTHTPHARPKEEGMPWCVEDVMTLFDLPYPDLTYRAQTVHRQHFPGNQVQISTLLSIKTGACPEDCGYCSQSVHNKTGLQREKLLPVNLIIEKAKQAKAKGASRFCMGAAWRTPPNETAFSHVLTAVKAVREMGMETCVTLGMLTQEQAHRLKEAGLDFYNHNLDTSEEYYPNIVTTHSYQDRLDTLSCVNRAGLKSCAGGIIGMGESRRDRAKLLTTLANLPTPPPKCTH